MPGKRIKDPSLQLTWYEEAISNEGRLLTDWEGLASARPIPVKYVGNAWMQGSYDNITYSNSILDDHVYLRVTTDGGTTWRVIDLSPTPSGHNALTLGVATNGLALDEADQILTLDLATTSLSGAMSATDKTRVDAIEWYTVSNVGAGETLFKEEIKVGDDVTFYIKSLVAGTGVTLTPGTNSIQIDATGAGGGEVNTAANVGTLGTGLVDGKSGVELQFRNLHTTGSILTLTLDDVNNNIALEIVEANINHDSLLNFVANEHVDHSTVSISTSEGLIGGGDLTTTRTLTLSFDTLGIQTNLENTDMFAFYRNNGGEDLHYTISWLNLLEGEAKTYFDNYYTPLTRTISTTTGLSGGGTLSADRTLSLAINDLPVIAYDAADYIAVYDTSSLVHAKVTLADIIGELAVSITAGNGMDFTTITSTGPITLGTPSTLTETTTNSVTGTTHTHVVDLSTWELEDLGDVPAPTALYYLRRNAGDTAYEWVDPAIGATTPGLPTNSIQFNSASTFAGNAGLLYDPTVDTIFFTDPNASAGANLIFGTALTTDPSIHANTSGITNSLVLENDNAVQHYIQLLGGRVLLGNPTLEGNTFLHIRDANTINYDNVLKIDDAVDTELLRLTATGRLYIPELPSATTTEVLYFDTATGQITYGAKPTTGGGIQTLIADSLSGLMVNGGSTSSASSIELDQNDNKLASATIALTDYIGFYDVTDGIQKKTLLSGFPGWNLKLDGVLEDEIKFNNDVNFVAGTNMVLSYTDATNTITFNAVDGASQPIEDIAFDFNDVTGGIQTYILDLEASYDYNIIEVVLQSDANVAFTVDIASITSVTDTCTSTITTFISGDTVNTTEQVTLVLAVSSATFIRGKLRIKRI